MASDDAKKQELLQVLSKNYRPAVLGAPSALWNLSATLGFTLAQVEPMRRDPQVRLCLRYLVTPLQTAEFEPVEATDKEVAAFVTRQFRRFFQRSLGVALEMYPYGRAAAEVLYRDTPRGLEFDDLKYLAPRDAALYTIDGQAAFVRLSGSGTSLSGYVGASRDAAQSGPLDLWLAQEGRPAKGFWITHDPLYDPYYGKSALLAAWLPWRLKNLPTGGAMDSLAKWFYRHGYKGYIGRHPNALYQDSAEDTPADAQALMRQMLESLKTGADIVLDNSRDEKGEYQWSIDSYGEINGDATGLTAYVDFLDVQIQRGIGIPDGIITDSGSQGYAGRKIPEDAFYAGAEMDFNRIVETFDEQVCRPLVQLRWGRAADYAIKPKPLVPIRQQAAQQSMQGAAQPGAGGAGGSEESALAGVAQASGQGNARPGGVSALGHNRLGEDEEDGVYHGQEPPGAGWVEIAPGPRGGKRWKRPEPRAKSQEPEGPGPGTGRSPLVSRLLRSGAAAQTTARDAAARVGGAVWKKLSPKAQARLTRTWKLAKAVEHTVMVGFRKTEAIAREAGRARGLSGPQVARLGRVLATADLVLSWAVNFPAVTAATGNPLLGKLSSWVPAASLAYIAFSGARNPFATARAAWTVLSSRERIAQSPEPKRRLSGSRLSDLGSRLDRLVQAIAQHGADDWWQALLYAALDQCRGGMGDALAKADAAYRRCPAPPGQSQKLSAGPHRYGTTQFNLPPTLAQKVRRLALRIPDADLAGDGREDEPHVTCKYGLHKPVTLNKISSLIKGFGPVPLKLGKLSVFPATDAGGHDVLKIEVISPRLRRLNKLLSDNLPHTDSHSVYQPHITLAYLRPGLGRKHAGDGSHPLQGRSFQADALTCSPVQGEPGIVKLGKFRRGERDAQMGYQRMASATLPSWQPYQGPHGGQGWRNLRTGEIRYQDKPPEEHSAVPDPGKDTPAHANNKAPWHMTAAEFAKSGIQAFRTSQGSTYVYSRGQTLRIKTPHVGHEVKDVGLKQGSAVTYFTDEQGAREIGMWNSLQGGTGKRLIVQGDEILLTSLNPRTGQRGLDGKVRIQSTAPREGLSPVELWDPSSQGKGWFRANHPGNAITAIGKPDRDIHRQFVAAALAAGKQIPSEVLREYPELARQAGAKHLSSQRLEAGRASWVPWVVKSGPHKGRAAWKNPATGEIRYTPPTGKKANRVRAEVADGKAPRHAGIAGAPTAAQQAAARRWADASPGLSPDVAAEYVEHLSHALSMLPAGIARDAGAALEAGGVRFHPDLQTLRAEAQRINGKSAAGVVGFAHDRGMATDLHLDGGDDPRGTYVHELWHAADNGGFHSDDKGWQAAYKKDILKGKYLLSRYALTNASEGFAELGRALAAQGLPSMTQRFPNAMKHLKAKGLL